MLFSGYIENGLTQTLGTICQVEGYVTVEESLFLTLYAFLTPFAGIGRLGLRQNRKFGSAPLRGNFSSKSRMPLGDEVTRITRHPPGTLPGCEHPNTQINLRHIPRVVTLALLSLNSCA